jgi:riboflavin synthase
MFTGIVEEMGPVVDLEVREGATRLTVEGKVTAEGTTLGDSIGVNGVCLTVVALEGARMAFEAVPETLRRSNLGRLKEGQRVNLERAVPEGRPMGGHYVQGHVDATAELVAVDVDGEARNVTFRIPEELARYVVEKGYVALDGVSLTVVEVEGDRFMVTLVPHTQEAVTLGAAPVGYVANFEVDVLAKYVERVVGPRLDALEARLAKLEG